jgi:hypothetical protein
MRTKHFSFQLEETIPGTFLAQGWLGGILTGFVYMVAYCLSKPTEVTEILLVSAWFLVLGTIVGVFKSILMWMPYRVFQFQVRAVTRVALASSLTVLLAFVLARVDRHFEESNLIRWLLTWLMAGLPTAILIGSSVKPWNLFTFGTLAGERRRNALGTLGTLPLRFLSLLTLAAACLYAASKLSSQIPSLEFILTFCIVVAYLLFTAYVTFRSPKKVILDIAGVVANIPVVLVGWFAFVYHHNRYSTEQTALYICTLCTLFVTAWAVFLAARLTVPSNTEEFSLSTLSNTPPTQIEQRDHDCLGSRFVEWQQRVA